MRSSREHDILEGLLEKRVIILEISSRFAPGLLSALGGCEAAHVANGLNACSAGETTSIRRDHRKVDAAPARQSCPCGFNAFGIKLRTGRQHVANDPGSLSKAADISAQAISKHGMFKGDLRCRYPNRSSSPTAPRTSASWRPGAGRPGLCSSTGWRRARDWPGWMSVLAMAPSLSSFLRDPRLHPFARSIPPTHRLRRRARKYRPSRSSFRLATRWRFLTTPTASTSR